MLQKTFAYAALFLLPFPALNFGVSFTFGDALLVLAVALNTNALSRLHSFQIPFLCALPFFIISTLMDADSDLISVVQVLYIWGFVLPFGWCAFTNLPIPRMAQVLLLSAVMNGVVAVGQNALIIPMLENQKSIVIGGEVARAAGLSIGCNTLVMSLTPCLLLLGYVRGAHLRVVVLLLLLVGMLSSVSKSILLAVPGLLFYLYRDREKRRILPALAVASLIGAVGIEQYWGLDELWYRMSETAERRAENTDESLDTRTELVFIALELVPQCVLFGFGPAGTHERISGAADSTVHVYYLGLIMIAGIPAASLLLWGMWLQLSGLWKIGEVSTAAFVAAHLLACLVMTVLMLSFQNLPFLVGGAVLARRSAQRTTGTRRSSTPKAVLSNPPVRQLAALHRG